MSQKQENYRQKKMIEKVISKNGKEIQLTAERWSHIVEAHDYMAGNQDLVFRNFKRILYNSYKLKG